MPNSPFIVYVDESGDHGLTKVNDEFPIFVLCAAIFDATSYMLHDAPLLTAIKFKHWGHDSVVFHNIKIRKRLFPFNIFRTPENSQHFKQDLSTFFEKSKVTIVAAAIDKAAHKKRYSSPINPYFLSLQFVLERTYGHIRNKTTHGDEIVCLFESRGRTEDATLEGWLATICNGENQWRCRLPFRAQFAVKEANIPGLQVADLAAYPIARHVQRPHDSRPDWDAVRPRFRHSPDGKLLGWGLKVFP